MLSHNRDESVKRRIASPPVRRSIEGVTHLFPVDPQGKGTWIAVSESGRIASLLNGGRRAHAHRPPYKHSRGLIIPAYLRYPSFTEFFSDFDFTGLEPFTMLVFEKGEVFEIVLDDDGARYRKINPDRPFIYSSSTLYTEMARNRKEEEFIRWYLANPYPTRNDHLAFQRGQIFEKEPDKSTIPPGHILKTVSITSIHHLQGEVKMDYYDLVNDLHFWYSLEKKLKSPESCLGQQTF